MASRIGLSQSAFASRLTGDVDFRFSELEAVARSLGVPLSALIPTDAAEVTS
jgi:transcriptional regulator with XRE-family HTH domain